MSLEHVAQHLLHARAADDAPEVEAGDALCRHEAEEGQHEQQTTEADGVSGLFEADLRSEHDLRLVLQRLDLLRVLQTTHR